MLLRRNAAVLALALLSSAGLSSCTSNSRPSAEEISRVIQADGTDDAIDGDIADCMGKVMYESDVSDETLKKAVESNGTYFETNELPAEDKAVMESEAFAKPFNACLESLLSETPTKPDNGIVEGEENPSDPSGGKTKPAPEKPKK